MCQEQRGGIIAVKSDCGDVAEELYGEANGAKLAKMMAAV